MKLSAIKRCCVEEKEFYIYESDCGEQWIGTHTAAWPVEGDLKLTEGSIAAIFDLKPKKAAQMDVLALPLNRGSCLYAAPATEWDAQELGIVEYLGERCLLLTYRGRMLAVDMAKVKAARCAEDYQCMKIGINTDGEPLVFVKDGMLTTAVILPESEEVVDAIRAMIGAHGAELRFAGRQRGRRWRRSVTRRRQGKRKAPRCGTLRHHFLPALP